MFIAIPLANKPTWQSPPWMTVLLIVVNMLVYWGWQAPEERTVQANAERYAASGLAEIEIPRYIAHLEQQAAGHPDRQPHLETVQALWSEHATDVVYQDMWHEQSFRQALLAGQIITVNDPQHGAWQDRRSRLAPYEPEPFTGRWALHFDRPVIDNPGTWLSATFLHGNTEHLLGNMVFLFLFGFTLEMALGSRLYLVLYLMCGAGASLVSLWAHAGSPGMGLGASGAISGLMAMYVVMYRLRRITFFYMLFFYFNHAKWPALVMLPVYMAHEALQQWIDSQGVDYMAHLGGLATGAVLMAVLMSVKKLDAPANLAPAEHGPLTEDQTNARAAIERARRLTDEQDYAGASQAWARAARLHPGDVAVLEPWFEVARHFPESEAFHAAAKGLLNLPAPDTASRRRLHTYYQSYVKLARPGARLSARTLAHLISAFVKLQLWNDAQRLARALNKSAPGDPHWPETLLLMVNDLVHHQQFEAAMAWLPALLRHAPDAPVTRLLAQRDPLAS